MNVNWFRSRISMTLLQHWAQHIALPAYLSLHCYSRRWTAARLLSMSCKNINSRQFTSLSSYFYSSERSSAPPIYIFFFSPQCHQRILLSRTRALDDTRERQRQKSHNTSTQLDHNSILRYSTCIAIHACNIIV